MSVMRAGDLPGLVGRRSVALRNGDRLPLYVMAAIEVDGIVGLALAGEKCRTLLFDADELVDLATP